MYSERYSRYITIAIDDHNFTLKEQFGTVYSRHTFAAAGSYALHAWQDYNLFPESLRETIEERETCSNYDN